MRVRALVRTYRASDESRSGTLFVPRARPYMAVNVSPYRLVLSESEDTRAISGFYMGGALIQPRPLR